MLRQILLLPLNYISYLFGIFTEIKFPPIVYLSKVIFIWLYRIDLSEASLKFEQYESLNQLFIRDLIPNTRQIEAEPISPVDGYVRTYGQIQNYSILQVKGQAFKIKDLILDDHLSERLNLGTYFNLYLAPHNYHNVHAPIAGKILKTIVCPGKLYPVNDFTVNRIPNVLASNERIIIQIENNSKLCVLVMVGALNVGKMTLTYCDVLKNKERIPFEVKHPERSLLVAEKIGTFNMGSSVVLLFEPGFFDFQNSSNLAQNFPIKLGMNLTKL